MSETQNFEKRYAQVARSLASHLIDYAHTRKDEDNKKVAAAKTELCRIYREEQDAKRIIKGI